jgi:hypothetical protein
MTKTILIALLVLELAASPILAQPQEAEAWRGLVTSLEPAATIAVRLKNGNRLKGTFVQHTDDALLLKPRTRIAVPALSIAFTEIESIERWKIGWSPGQKVLLGVGIGFGVIGLAFLAVIASLE